MIFLFLFIVVVLVVAVQAEKLAIRYPRFKRPLAVLGAISVAVFWIGITGSAIYWYNHRPKTELINIEEQNIEKQIVSLSPWSDYADTRWLVFDVSGGFKITVEPYSKEPRDIAVGHWSFDRNQNAIVLSSPEYSASYRYLLEQDQAYLGGDPVENTPLKDLWISVPSSSNEENSGPEYP